MNECGEESDDDDGDDDVLLHDCALLYGNICGHDVVTSMGTWGVPFKGDLTGIVSETAKSNSFWSVRTNELND